MDLHRRVSELSILENKQLQVVRFKPNWAQIEYLDAARHQLETTGRIRIIVLKARQLGISTVTEAMLFVMCFTIMNYRSMVIAHEIPASQNLLKMTQRYWDTYPFKRLYNTRYAGKNHLEWVETGSSMHVATAGNKGVGRSATIHGVHASEVGFWPDPKEAFVGLRQTIPEAPGTIIVMESTANGSNMFKSEWEAAEQGETEFLPLFFPWHRHPNYTASAIGIPHFNLGKLDSEEKILRRIGISDDRLAWRRWAIRNKTQNDLQLFHQEYPSTPSEAFIASGTNIFSITDLNKVYKPEPGKRGQLLENSARVEFHERSDGPLTLFRKVHPNPDLGTYIVAGDPTKTTVGDFACIQVINRRTLEQVAEWRARIDPITFADELFMLGKFFNLALVSTEIEGPGYSTIGALLAKNYPRLYQRSRADSIASPSTSSNYGWSTTLQTKNLMIGWVMRFVVDGSITIHSSTLYNEMKEYVRLPSGEYGPSTKDGFDDCVMAFAQAIIVNVMEPVLMAPEGPVDGSLVLPNTPGFTPPTGPITLHNQPHTHTPDSDTPVWESWPDER